MTHRYIKIGATTAVLVIAFTGLLWSTLREGTEYYKHVDEVMANQQAWQGKRLQLHGHVVDAYYTGIVPDTFKDEAEVVLKGQLGPNGFQVGKDGVVAKCPSKYEAAASQAGAGS